MRGICSQNIRDLSERLRGDACDCRTVWYVVEDDGAGPYRRPLSYPDARDNSRYRSGTDTLAEVGVAAEWIFAPCMTNDPELIDAYLEMIADG